MRPLDRDDVRGILQRGGTILGTSRTDPYVHGDGYESVPAHDRGRTGSTRLIVIGGDGTLRSALALHEEGLPVVGVPKTIDNDIAGTDLTFGFDTAVMVATEAIDRLTTTAESHNRVMVVEVMGRTQGLDRDLRRRSPAAPTRSSIPERPTDLETSRARSRPAIGAATRTRSSSSRRGSRSPRATLSSTPSTRSGSSGSAGSRYRLAPELERRTGFETRVTVLGHLQRGGTPTAFDRVLATRFGVAAADLAAEGRFGEMAALRGDAMRRGPARRSVRRGQASPPELIDVATTFLVRRRFPALVAVDLDGTLLRVRPHRVDRAREALAAMREAGAEVVIVTARSPRSVHEIAREAGIAGLAICANGATLYDLDRSKIVAHTPLAAETRTRLVARACASRFPASCSAGSSSCGSAASRPTRRSGRRAGGPGRRTRSRPAMFSRGTSRSRSCSHGSEADLTDAFDVAVRVAGAEASVTLAGDAFVELDGAGRGKEQALARARRRAGIVARRVVAFGDQLTDAACSRGRVTVSQWRTPHPRCSRAPTRSRRPTTTTASPSRSSGSSTTAGRAAPTGPRAQAPARDARTRVRAWRARRRSGLARVAAAGCERRGR